MAINYLINQIKNSRIVKNSVFNLTGFFAQAVIVLVSTPLLIKGMGVEQYGLWVIASSFLGIMGFFDMGISSSIVKFIAEYTSQGDKNGVSSVIVGAICFYLIFGTIISIPLYFFGPKIVFFLKMSSSSSLAVEKAIRVLIFGFIPLLLGNLGKAASLGLQRYEIGNLIALVRIGIMQFTAIIIVFLGGQLYEVFLGTILVIWLWAFVALRVAFRLLIPHGLRFFFDWTYCRRIFSFSSHILLQNLGAQIFSSVDRLAVGRILGLEAVTYYSVGTMVATNLHGVVGSISHTLLPAASETIGLKNYQKLYDMFIKGTSVACAISCGAGLVALTFSKPFLQFWLGADFMKASLSAFRILILAYCVYTINAPAFFIANGIGIPWINTCFSIIGGCITILLIFILGKIWQLNGVALANFGFSITLLIPLYVFFKLKYELAKNHRNEIPKDLRQTTS
jgi:O-antigen/teichoic acid export membrane protein